MSAGIVGVLEKIDALSRRERILVLLTVIAAIWMILSSLMIDAQLKQQKELKQQISDGETEVSVLKQQVDSMRLARSKDPDADNKVRLSQLKAEEQVILDALKTVKRDLVSPSQMAALLKDVLKQNDQLKLKSLKTVPVELINVANAASKPNVLTATNTAQSGVASTTTNKESVQIADKDKSNIIYRHGVELSVQGRYFDLMDYLKALEKLPWRILWGKVELTTEDFPRSTLKLTLYTLSLEPTWLSL